MKQFNDILVLDSSLNKNGNIVTAEALRGFEQWMIQAPMICKESTIYLYHRVWDKHQVESGEAVEPTPIGYLTDFITVEETRIGGVACDPQTNLALRSKVYINDALAPDTYMGKYVAPAMVVRKHKDTKENLFDSMVMTYCFLTDEPAYEWATPLDSDSLVSSGVV